MSRRKKEISQSEMWHDLLLEIKDCRTCVLYKDSTYFGYLCKKRPGYHQPCEPCPDYWQEGTLGI